MVVTMKERKFKVIMSLSNLIKSWSELPTVIQVFFVLSLLFNMVMIFFLVTRLSSWLSKKKVSESSMSFLPKLKNCIITILTNLLTTLSPRVLKKLEENTANEQKLTQEQLRQLVLDSLSEVINNVK